MCHNDYDLCEECYRKIGHKHRMEVIRCCKNLEKMCENLDNFSSRSSCVGIWNNRDGREGKDDLRGSNYSLIGNIHDKNSSYNGVNRLSMGPISSTSNKNINNNLAGSSYDYTDK